MADRRRANEDWLIANEEGVVPTWERVGIAVMMDIRGELQNLNGLLRCPDFQSIPRTLRAIRQNTNRKKAKK